MFARSLADTSSEEIVPTDLSEPVLEDQCEHPLFDQVEVDKSNASLVLKDDQPAGMQVGRSNDVDDVVQDILNPATRPISISCSGQNVQPKG